jgi:hypothetical protein
MRPQLALVAVLVAGGAARLGRAEEQAAAWRVGTPIVTYYAGPPMSDAVATQMAEGGFNVVWCGEQDLDLVHRHGLRGMLHDGLLAPSTLDSASSCAQLDALVDRVRAHPALYSYYITDEPGAAAFAGLGRLVAHLRARDPGRMAYINLFPTYASNQQLGTVGDTVTAYREHLRQYMEIVKPQLVSYDHYQFMVEGDGKQYFLNLQMIREAAQGAGVPFLNIVQACSWAPAVRVPVANEMRYLVYTTLGYGAEGISYYVYSATGHRGGMRNEDGTPTPIFEAVMPLNRQFVAIATELQGLRSRSIHHTAMTEPGCQPLPADAPFRPQDSDPTGKGRGLMLGCFGKGDAATHVLVVNLDYRAEATTAIDGPGNLERFEVAGRRWVAEGGPQAALRLPPGGGQLLRVAP